MLDSQHIIFVVVFWETSIMFSSVCTNLYSQQQYMSAPFFPHLISICSANIYQVL